MGGGLIQLVSKSAQDVYLTGNPQITFFKVVYRRHTNFSMEFIQQVLTDDIHNGRKIDCHIKRDGDLIHRVYFEYINNKECYYPSNFGSYMINKVDLLIGGQVIDSHLGHWLEINSRLNNLSFNTGELKLTDQMCGIDYNQSYLYNNYQKCSGSSGVHSNDIYIDDDKNTSTIIYKKKVLGKLSIPLQFSFCKNPGLALPLIALQYNEVVIHLEFRDITPFMNDASKFNSNIFENNNDIINPINMGHGEIWVEYIYLDTDERRRFAQISHEYLIEQIQYKEEILTINNFDINLTQFNNPVKELVFSCDWDTIYDHGTIPGLGNNKTDISIKINGNNIFSPHRSLHHFTRNNILDNHSGNPNSNLFRDGRIFYNKIESNDKKYLYVNGGKKDNIFFNSPVDIQNNQIMEYIYNNTNVSSYDIIGVHSFALKPELHQPTGSFNFSTVSKSQLIINNMCPPILIDDNNKNDYIECRTFRVYAISYNILRIMSGMGKLAYI
jgi:hypothetical protein